MKSGQLSPCEYINVESEFAAMSVAIGASVTGARAYTATSSQGFLFMVEAVYNAAGLGLPGVQLATGDGPEDHPLTVQHVVDGKDGGRAPTLTPTLPTDAPPSSSRQRARESTR